MNGYREIVDQVVRCGTLQRAVGSAVGDMECGVECISCLAGRAKRIVSTIGMSVARVVAGARALYLLRMFSKSEV